jgi:hypothetical protein
MTGRKLRTDIAKSRFDDFIERITSRIGKIAALVVAIGGLAVAAVTQSESIRAKLVAIGWYAPQPCVRIDSATFPETVKLSEWDRMKVNLQGRNNCATVLGLYVTFFRDMHNKELFVLRVPHGDFPECKGLAADLEPKCWNPKKPIVIGKGKWSWDVPLPPMERLSNPQRVERILVSWSVRDYDEPTKPAILADTAAIMVQSDAGNTM